MEIKNNYDCEKCLNKPVCKYYDSCKNYSNKDLIVKLKAKEEQNKENLTLTITCDYYRTEPKTSPLTSYTIPYINTEPYGNNGTGKSRKLDDYITYTNSDQKVDSVQKSSDTACGEYLGSSYATGLDSYATGLDSSKNISKVITKRKHI
jgi:hypothetical protein